MCDDDLRDGTTTQRAPITDCAEECDTDEKFGHHESLNYYEECAIRERNKGLFIADRVTYLIMIIVGLYLPRKCI